MAENSTPADEGRQQNTLTDIRVIDGHLHIDGYPNAKKLVELKTEVGHRIAGLRRHQSTLASCERAMQDLPKIRTAFQQSDEIFLIGIVISYFSCFGRSEATAPLNAEKVFHGMPDAKDIFEHWKAFRDKHLVHDESEFSSHFTGLALDEKSDVLDVISLRMTPKLSSFEHWLQLLYNLIDHTQKMVAELIEVAVKRAWEDARAMTPKERENLPEIRYGAPTPNAAFRIRPARRP